MRTAYSPVDHIFVRFSVTVQSVCALAALTVRKPRLKGKNPIGVADLEWIFACNCEGTEQLQRKFNCKCRAESRISCADHKGYGTARMNWENRVKE